MNEQSAAIRLDGVDKDFAEAGRSRQVLAQVSL